MAEQRAAQTNDQQKLDFWSTFRYAILGFTEPESTSSIREIAGNLDAWKPDAEKLDSLFTLSQRSLTEVTRLTEYEDGKANRILMSMAFLSALAGVLFSKFVDKYHHLLSGELWSIPWLLVLIVYSVFFFYVLLLIAGVIFVLYAVMPRFNIPTDWKHKSGIPASFLFFEKMIEVTPTAWADAFSKRPPDTVKSDYIKNSVLESFLIAEKIRIKLGKLQHGLRLLWNSTRVFGLWLVLYVIVIIALAGFERSQDPFLRLQTMESQVKDVTDRYSSIDKQLTNQSSKSEELVRKIEKMEMENKAKFDGLAGTLKQLKDKVKVPSRAQKAQKTD
jgi:hypothetical protein